jgi:hypothetical protein
LIFVLQNKSGLTKNLKWKTYNLFGHRKQVASNVLEEQEEFVMVTFLEWLKRIFTKKNSKIIQNQKLNVHLLIN